MPSPANHQILFDGYALDRSLWTLRWQTETIALSRKSFDVLLYLIDHREQVVGKDDLMRSLWPGQIVEESNLTQQIFLLRKALSRHGSGARIIETVPGRGYRFTPIIEAPAALRSEIQVSASQSITRVTIEEQQETRNSQRLIALTSLFVAALLFTAWFIWNRWQDRVDSAPVQAVLMDMDGGTGDAVLDRSLADALRIDLSQSPFVSIVPPDTVRATLSAMKRERGDLMTPAVARDVCERTDSQVVLHGTVVRIGEHYLLTEQARSCVNDSLLAAAKSESSKSEDLPGSIDSIAANLRRQLGESRRSIARFNAPLFPENTASLDALKAYSEAERKAEIGDFPDAISLMKEAVAADPAFASAYNRLAAYYGSVADVAGERDAVRKAYDLRDSANAFMRLSIIAHYNTVTTGDLFAAERNYRSWTQLYPNSALGWNRLGVVQRSLGEHREAVQSSARALALWPKNTGYYYNHAMDQMHAGDLAAARDTCEHAIAAGMDGDQMRETLLMIAFALHDDALIQAQYDWASDHSDASATRFEEGYVAKAGGRFNEAQRLFAEGIDAARKQDLGGVADRMARLTGIGFIESGEIERGSALLRSAPRDPESGEELVGVAEMGDLPEAREELRVMLAAHPQDTFWNLVWAPTINSVIALAEHKPQEALAALEKERPIDTIGLDAQSRRGRAYLAAGEPAMAEKEFRSVVEHQYLDPTVVDYPLSWLGLGRALAAEGKSADAMDAYRHFLSLWARADPDANYLKLARAEFAALPQGH